MLHVERTFIPVLALSVLLPATARADEVNGLRCSVAPAADADGDGIPDVAIASRRREPTVHEKPCVQGSVHIVSGRDGTPIRTLHAPRGTRHDFGRALADVGDVDGDGASDLAVSGENRVRVFSGKSGDLLHELGGELGLAGIGHTISGGGDVDGDGVVDIAVFCGVDDMDEMSWVGVIALYSGASGELLRAIGGPHGPLPGLGDEIAVRLEHLVSAAVTLVPDRDGDGRAEIAFTQAEPLVEREEVAGWLVVLDPWTLHEFQRSPLPPASFGGTHWVATAVGDVNADGVSDVLVSIVHQDVLLLSGKDGSELHRHDYAGGYMYGEGTSLDVLGDVSGDDVPDYLIAANEDSLDCDPGFACLYSGSDGSPLGCVELPESAASPLKNPLGGNCGHGLDACAIGDVDGDGMRDLAVHVPRRDELFVVSGATRAVLVRVDTRELLQEKADEPR